jgi:hypothetical protein
LSHRGIEVWLDEQQMDPGASLPKRIQDAIRSCSHLLVLLTKTSTMSIWVQKEIAFARKRKPPVTILPVVGESDVQSPLLDETVGIDISDTCYFETALDNLTQAVSGNADQSFRNISLLRKDLEQLGREMPQLSSVQLSEYESHAYFNAIPIDSSTMHEVETFAAIQWDLAAKQDEPKTLSSAHPPSDNVAFAAADLFRKHGLGYYVLTRFVETCENRQSVHNMFSYLTDGLQQNDGAVEKVCHLFAKSQQPQHVTLRWFVIREFERLSEMQMNWAIAHFIQNAKSPENDGIFTAFALFKRMPNSKALENLWERWISQGQIGFDGKLHADIVILFFRLMNDAIVDGLAQFHPGLKLFRNHFRSLARGRKLQERLAAADILSYAQKEHYTQLPNLCEELSAALSSAEWKELNLPAKITSLFAELVTKAERGDDVMAARLRLYEVVNA